MPLQLHLADGAALNIEVIATDRSFDSRLHRGGGLSSGSMRYAGTVRAL